MIVVCWPSESLWDQYKYFFVGSYACFLLSRNLQEESMMKEFNVYQ